MWGWKYGRPAPSNAFFTFTAFFPGPEERFCTRKARPAPRGVAGRCPSTYSQVFAHLAEWRAAVRPATTRWNGVHPPLPWILLMSDEEPFFIIRAGAVWACWLDGKPAVKLGGEAEVLAAMKGFISGSGRGIGPGDEPPRAAQPPPTPPPPPPPPVGPPPPQRQRGENDRLEPRHEISIVGRVGSGSRARDVTVQDLSEGGCRFHDFFGGIAVGTRTTIKLGPIGPIGATVRWCRDEEIGIQFDNPLYPSVLEHIRQHFDLRR